MIRLRSIFAALLALSLSTAASAQFISQPRLTISQLDPNFGTGVQLAESAPPSVDQTLPIRLRYALDSLYARTSEEGRYGVTVSLLVSGQPQWVGTAGISNIGVPMRPDHLVEIGSNTKSFIAATILELEEEGKLAITDSIVKYLPHFTFVDSAVTIKQLLEHSSGVYDYLNDDTNAVLLTDAYTGNTSRLWKPEEVMESIGKPNFTPGKSYKYCNTGYLLLGMVIESVTKHRVADELRTRFFTPLQLNETFAGSDDSIAGEFAHQWYPEYNGNAAWDLGTIDHTAQLSLAWTAGYIVSTPTDLVRWADALYRGKLLSAASMTKMLKMNTWPDGSKYGFATAQLPYGSKKVFGHSGRLPGFNSVMYTIPRDSVALVLITNSEQLPGDPSLNDYVLALLAEVYRPVKSSVAETEHLRAYQIEAGRTLKVEYPASTHIGSRVSFYDVLGRQYALEGSIVGNGMRVDLMSLPRGAFTYTLPLSSGQLVGKIYRR